MNNLITAIGMTVLIMLASGILALAVAGALALWDAKRETSNPKLQSFGMSEEQLHERLLAAPGSPVYAALLAIVDEQTIELMNAALEAKLPEPELRHLLGGASALADLKERIEARIEEAREQKAEQEEEQRKQAARAAAAAKA